MASSTPENFSVRQVLSDPGLRMALREVVRRKVPSSAVDDIVQATLTEALASPHAPQESESFRRWMWGIARHKVADFHRGKHREVSDSQTEISADPISHGAGARELLRWAEHEMPEGEGVQETFDWMLREGDGEKLEWIALDENVPAPRLRQRVARLRRHFRERWAAQAAAFAAVAAFMILFAWWWKRNHEQIAVVPIVPESPTVSAPIPEPRFEMAKRLREKAVEACEAKQYQECLKGLDEAKQLDPQGDDTEQLRKLRKVAKDALEPGPLDKLNDSLRKGPLPKSDSTSAPRPKNSTPPPQRKSDDSPQKEPDVVQFLNPPAPPVTTTAPQSNKPSPKKNPKTITHDPSF